MKPKKKIKSHLYPVIIAGGKGTRFWPYSRKNRPKQFLTIFGKTSLLRSTFDRVRRIAPLENILVITEKSQVEALKKEIPSLPKNNILSEPIGRNTAPAVGLAALEVDRRDPNGILLILPSDHLIRKEKEFIQKVRLAEKAAKKHQTLVTFGITPNQPETGYGYIRLGKSLDSKGTLNRVLKFVEKPTRARAIRYLKSGQYLWNSGMFCMPSRWMLDQTREHLPKFYKDLQHLKKFLGKRSFPSVLQKSYKRIKPISIDYGIVEKAGNILTIRSDFGWSDVGSWNIFEELLTPDSKGNRSTGPMAAVGASGCTVLSNKKFIGVIGARDLIVIETDDALLICKKGDEQKTRDLVDILSSGPFKKYT